MITQTGITLFNKVYNPETRMYDWTASFYAEASVYEEVRVSMSGDGLKSRNVIIARIPTEASVTISNGDRLVCGEAEIPPDDAYTVVGFSDNRRGSRQMRHWKVICE